MLNRKLRDEVIKLNCGKKFTNAHDWYTALTAAFTGGDMIFCETPTIKYRQHQGNTAGVKPKETFTILNIVIRLLHSIKAAHRNWQENYCEQSRYFAAELEALNIPGEKGKFLHELANIEQEGKITRIKFYAKHSLLPDNLIRKIWALLMI